MLSTMRHAFAIAALVGLFLWLGVPQVSSEPYNYDEADYMYAASLGLAANYSDTPTQPAIEFVRAGLSGGKESSQRRSLSELIRAGNDVLFYRHWHGPAFEYFLIPFSRLGLGEHGVRVAMLSIPVATLVLTFLGCIWLMPGARGMIAAILCGTLLLSSHSVLGATELGPHQLFALCCVGFLFSLAKTVVTGMRSYWYLAVVAAALAFCTMELALILVITLLIYGYIERRRLQAGWYFTARSLGLFTAVVLVVWPAGLVKLSFVKAYLFMAYLWLSRKSPWGNAGFLDTWIERFKSSPVEWIVIATGLILFLQQRSLKQRRPEAPILTYAILMMIATIRVWSGTSRYSLPFMPALDLSAGLALAPVIGSLRRPAGIAVVTALIVGLVGTAEYQVRAQPHNANPRPAAVLSFIHQNDLADKTLLVPQDDLPMIHYYFPRTRLRGYYDQYPPMQEAEAFRPDRILLPGYPVRWEPLPSR